MPSDRILEINNINKSFDKKGASNAVFEDFNLGMEEGEFLAILGPSGCGKSTLLEMMAGFDMDFSGDMVFKGEKIEGTSKERAVVFQQDALFPWMRIFDNIAYGLKIKKMKREEIKAKVESVLNKVGLLEYADHYPHELSGGMKQRVALARVLVLEPEMLLMDEPFGALDSFTRLRMQELLLEMKDSFSSAVVFITHDIDEALLLADRIVMMDAGGKGECSELKPKLKKYNGSLTDKMLDSDYLDYKKEIIEWFHLK